MEREKNTEERMDIGIVSGETQDDRGCYGIEWETGRKESLGCSASHLKSAELSFNAKTGKQTGEYEGRH